VAGLSYFLGYSFSENGKAPSAVHCAYGADSEYGPNVALPGRRSFDHAPAFAKRAAEDAKERRVAPSEARAADLLSRESKRGAKLGVRPLDIRHGVLIG